MEIRKDFGRKKNPFRISYLSIAVICCLALSFVFYVNSYMSSKRTQMENNHKKAELILQDLEIQMQLMEEVALRLTISREYQPVNFKAHKYNERVLLEDFEKYRFYVALVKENFLYYGGDSIFHIDGKRMDLKVYLDELSEEEQETFLKKLTEVREGIADTKSGVQMHSAKDALYVMLPFRVSDTTGKSNAVLCFVIGHNDLGERFQIVSGGINGNISLYSETELLFCNQEEACMQGQKNVLTAETLDGSYTLCYLPENESFLHGGLFTLQLALLLMDAILILIVANLFADRSYKPIVELSEKYRSEVLQSEEVWFEDALEEINHMMDSMLRSNMLVSTEMQQKQKLLKTQVLRAMLEGGVSFDVQPYLDSLGIRLPGPYFYVISVSFDKADGVTESFLIRLQEEVELLSNEAEQMYVYAVYNLEKKRLSVISSIAEADRKEEMTEAVCELAHSFEYEPLVGCGKLYETVSRLSASWLESVDNIHSMASHRKGEKQAGFYYDCEPLHRITGAMTEGNEAGAMEGLKIFAAHLQDMPMSLLMQQYIFSDFLSEFTRQARKCRIELSNQNISQIISAKDIKSFEEAAGNLIHEFCASLQHFRTEMEKEESLRVYEYVNAHFTEYDLSIEKTAAELETTTTSVRQAIYEHTGKMYKEYLMFLRIEYAKMLLMQENMTVDEVCRKVGYSSISYFRKLFKEMTGTTPANYKRGG